jgi:nicotinate phosphoribosyltransferase
VVAEVFARGSGIFAGLPEVLELFREKPGLEVESVAEGDPFSTKETLLRIRGPYSSFGMYETVLLGMLASASGWATAARECVEAAGGKPVLSFGARHVHPAVAPVMERTAVVAGGCQGASCILGAKLAGIEPRGTIPHAAILIVGDTVKSRKSTIGSCPRVSRNYLVDNFKVKPRKPESRRKPSGKLSGIRLDTPGERGGVTRNSSGSPVASRSGGIRQGPDHRVGRTDPGANPSSSEAGAEAFGVGSYLLMQPRIYDNGHQDG